MPAMDLTFSERETAFRDELRAWLEANDPGAEPIDDTAELPLAPRLAAAACTRAAGPRVHWPKEYGGRDAGVTESAIFYEELAPRPRAAARQRARHPAWAAPR